MISTFARKIFNHNRTVIIFAIILGIMFGYISLIISGWSLYRLLFVFFVLLFLPILFAIVGNISRTLLIALVFAIPLNFSLAPFAKAPPHPGGAQPVVLFYLYDFPLAGVIVVWVWEVVFARRRTIPKSGLFLIAAFWILWSIVSIYNSSMLNLSWFEILRMSKLFMLMMAVSTLVRDKQDIKAIFIALFLSLVIQCFVSVVQYTTGSFFNNLLGIETYLSGTQQRVSGTIGWSNTIGAFVGTITTIAIIMVVSNADRSLNTLGLIAGFSGFVTLIMTFSRGAWIAFVLALIFGVFVSIYRRWLNIRDVSRLAMLIPAIGIMAIPFSQQILNRLALIDLNQAAIADRFSLINIAFSMITAHPILGVGINTFIDVMKYYDITGISFSFPEPVHNVYLLIAAETGIVGLCIFLMFVMKIGSVLFQGMKSSNRLVSLSAICLTSGMASILVSNIADMHLRTDVLFVLFWFLAGLGLALVELNKSMDTHTRSKDKNSFLEDNVAGRFG